MISPSLYVKSSSLHIINCYTGLDGRGRDGQNIKDHPFRMCICIRKAKQKEIGVHHLENCVHLGECDDPFVGLQGLHFLCPTKLLNIKMMHGGKELMSSSSLGFLYSLNVNTLPPLAPCDGFEKDNKIVHVDHKM